MLDVRSCRDALALPGLRPLLLVAILARVPVAATAVAMTLHVLDLGHGYFAAGLVGAVLTVGSAFGAPLLGRLVDRRGLRPMLLLTTAVSALFWGTAPVLPYPVLLGAALVGGLLTLPVFSVIRQSIAALGTPLVGAVIDASAPAWGFAATGLLGALIALAVILAEVRHRRWCRLSPDGPLRDLPAPAARPGTTGHGRTLVRWKRAAHD
ncbi:hypothetical protein GCM10012279_16360 [Micromonospora yangpuensis]|uniref:Major Facilitator Superfamily protein n=1 Tax=Micromonospora yangpuensis TaxID=683228 RepID=A0A1C6VHE0_9ACTN|nr:hypothetical protein GCM10012279_16360 [Micromonospora yangpuensis]SCL65743.1 hypothetical protein GA0070617_5853 [Micromonospora yangpuensis]